MEKILCVIPARSGSKGLPNKNIKIFKGKPLLAWSIYHSQNNIYSKQIRTIVSTDSEEYAIIAKKWGAEVPFLRPIEISGDLSTDYECINHCVNWLRNNDNYIPDIIIHLRPTQPCRKIDDINKCLKLFIKNRDKFDSLRTVIPVEKSPYKMYNIKNNMLIPLFNDINRIKEPFNQARQLLPQCYLHNGYIDILNESILKDKTISGNRIYQYTMKKEDTIDIDTLDDWKKAN